MRQLIAKIHLVLATVVRPLGARYGETNTAAGRKLAAGTLASGLAMLFRLDGSCKFISFE
jgi:hypothetical protein